MSVENSEEAVRARKVICEEVAGRVAVMINAIEKDGAMFEATTMACISNRTGGMGETEIASVHDWFHDAIKRLHLMVGMLQGQYDICIDESGKANIALSELVRELCGPQLDSDPDEAWKKVEERGGWLGLCHSSS